MKPLKPQFYFVGVEYPHGRGEALSLHIIFEAVADQDAQIGAVKWAINRQQANGFCPATCIQLSSYSIGRPDNDGYIKTGCSLGYLLEWKYDTSPFVTPVELLKHLESLKTLEFGRF